MARGDGYDIEDPAKIQGRDEVSIRDRSLGALRLRRALAALAPISGRMLLLGCGAGRYARAIERERPDLDVVGGDLSRHALVEARQRDPGGHYLGLDASALPFRGEAFTAVVFFDLLEHVPDWRTMLAEVARVLAPGGVLHCFVPLEGERHTVYTWLERSRRLPINRWKHDHVGHVNRFTAGQVLREAWDAGLRVDDVAYGFHLTAQVHDLIDYWARERQAGGPGLLPSSAVGLLARAAFIPTWRLSYLEDRLYSGRHLASGLYLTATKPA